MGRNSISYETTVDIYLDDFSDDDLIEELASRGITPWDSFHEIAGENQSRFKLVLEEITFKRAIKQNIDRELEDLFEMIREVT